MTSLRLTLVLAAAMAAAALAVPLPASAHARYKSSTPGKGEVVQTSPSRVEITFTQEVQKISGSYDIEVAKDRGASVAAGPAVVDDKDRSKMSAPLQPDLPPGRYVVNWKNVSDADGDPAEGAFSFYVRKQPTAVDSENDRQLEAVGAEAETPEATTSAAAAATIRPAATATPSASGGGGNTTIYVVIVGVAVGVIIGLGIWRFVLRPRHG